MIQMRKNINAARHTDALLHIAFYSNKLGANTAHVSVIPQYGQAEEYTGRCYATRDSTTATIGCELCGCPAKRWGRLASTSLRHPRPDGTISGNPLRYTHRRQWFAIFPRNSGVVGRVHLVHAGSQVGPAWVVSVLTGERLRILPPSAHHNCETQER